MSTHLSDEESYPPLRSPFNETMRLGRYTWKIGGSSITQRIANRTSDCSPYSFDQCTAQTGILRFAEKVPIAGSPVREHQCKGQQFIVAVPVCKLTW
jgi:hypothetical protein